MHHASRITHYASPPNTGAEDLKLLLIVTPTIIGYARVLYCMYCRVQPILHVP